MDATQAVTFTLAGETYGAPIAQVQEIVAWVPPIRVPDAPPWIEGLIDLRGMLVPVVDLRKRFGLPESAELATRCVIVAQIAGQAIGLLVDGVREVAFVQAVNQVPPAATSARSGFLSGVARIREGSPLVLLLALDRLLSADEVSALRPV